MCVASMHCRKSIIKCLQQCNSSSTFLCVPAEQQRPAGPGKFSERGKSGRGEWGRGEAEQHGDGVGILGQAG